MRSTAQPCRRFSVPRLWQWLAVPVLYLWVFLLSTVHRADIASTPHPATPPARRVNVPPSCLDGQGRRVPLDAPASIPTQRAPKTSETIPRLDETARRTLAVDTGFTKCQSLQRQLGQLQQDVTNGQAPPASATYPPADSVVFVAFPAPTSPTDALLEAYAASTTDEGSLYFNFLERHNATLEVEDGPDHKRVPFALDVVYTYVNGSSLRVPDGQYLQQSRLRDWGELRYSLRAVYNRAVCAPSTGPAAGSAPCRPTTFIRNVYIVVADDTQIPAYVNTSHPQIHIVMHKDIGLVDRTANSHAIETALHRIPGLSRFYVYFNNDQLWGRRISLFDYFRPLSAARALPRLARRGDDPQTTWVLEPVYYAEGVIESRECAVTCDVGAKGRTPSDPPPTVPVASRFFRLHCPSSNSDPHPAARDWRRSSNFNRGASFARIPGYWPTHSFAHYPSINDRVVMENMERDFEDVVAATRRQYTRTETSLWWTAIAPFYALSQRLRVDWDTLVAATNFTTPAPGATVSQLSEVSPHYRDMNQAMQPESFQFYPPSQQKLPGSRQMGRLQLRKLNDHIASLDGEEASYYFCMTNRYNALATCHREISQRGTGRQSVLFITINDDFSDFARNGNVLSQFGELLSSVTQHAPQSPFETAYELTPPKGDAQSDYRVGGYPDRWATIHQELDLKKNDGNFYHHHYVASSRFSNRRRQFSYRA